MKSTKLRYLWFAETYRRTYTGRLKPRRNAPDKRHRETCHLYCTENFNPNFSGQNLHLKQIPFS